MPILLAPLFSIALGLILAAAVARSLARDDRSALELPAGRVALVYGFAVLAPLVGYFLWLHGDWSYGYLVSWQRVPSAVDLLLVAITGAALPAAYALAAPRVREGSARAIAIMGFASFGVGVVLWLALLPRFSISATFAQYHGGFGRVPTASSALGRALALMDAVALAGFAGCLRALSGRG